jgi:hypothetical protein
MSSDYNRHYHTAGANQQAGHYPPQACPQLPGTVLRIFIPAGAVINLLNILELTSPTGICLILRIPVLQGGSPGVQSLLDAVKQAGGTVEVANM